MMSDIDRARSRVEYDADRAKKFRRFTMLFAIVDILSLIKLIYNCLFFDQFNNQPIYIVFWAAVMAIAGIISIILIVKLWLFEHQSNKTVVQLKQLKKDVLKKSDKFR